MHIYFSGIGGTGIGPLSLIARQAGFEVSGSDKQESDYIKYLKTKGILEISIGQSEENISNLHAQNPIDWVVYSSAVEKENPNHPELKFAKNNNIKVTKRDEFLSYLLEITNKKMIAIAGTHGKTTTTAMAIWLFKRLNMPISYSVGAKLSFGDMGEFDEKSEYFVYEADEYDRNFLSFSPEISIIPGIGYDHPDIYPTRGDYYAAFKEFITQSNFVYAHPEDLKKIGLATEPEEFDRTQLSLIGEVNRKNAQLVVEAICELTDSPKSELILIMNEFPGVSRRFEKIADNIYSDYAHTPEKIRGALQIAQEQAGENSVVVYEGLHNTRQHFIKDDLKHLFDNVKKLYVVPSYRAREDESLEDLTPEKIIGLTFKPEKGVASKLDQKLKSDILSHIENGDLVLCLTAGGGGSLDEWLRKEFRQ